MKKIILSVLILCSGKIFSQSDTAYKTENVFLVSYTNYDSKVVEFKDVRLTSIDSISLTFDEVVWGPSEKKNKYIPHKVMFSKINSFGYKVGTDMGTRIGYGALAGFVVGGIIGGLSAGYSPGGGSGNADSQRAGFIVIGGILFAIPGALIGAATGIGSKEYEVLDIAKYDSTKKFEIIKRLIKTGVKENE